MIMAQVVFGACKGTDKEFVERYDQACMYLGSLRWNGQLYSQELLDWCFDRLTAYVYLSDPKAIKNENHSESGLKELKRIRDLFGNYPRWTFLQSRKKYKSAEWQSAETLYLFTHLLDFTSPVCHGETGVPIPTFTIPIDYVSREDLLRWATSYRAHDTVQMDAGELEFPAYKQMAEPGSDLSKSGRELCFKIEQATQKPTYFYLNRYWGRKKGEENRLCPGCGNSWRVSKSPGEDKFHHFDFRCEPCRLVSHIAPNFENKRHARIGEWRGKEIKNEPLR